MRAVREICTPHDGSSRDRKRVGSCPLHAEKRGGVGLTVTTTAKKQGRFSGTRLLSKYQSPGTHPRETVRRRAPRGQIVDCCCVEDQWMSGWRRWAPAMRGREGGGFEDRRIGVGERGCGRERLVRVCFQTIKCVFLGHPIHFRKMQSRSSQTVALVKSRIQTAHSSEGATLMA